MSLSDHTRSELERELEHLLGVRAQIDAVIGAIRAVLADHESLLQPFTAHLVPVRAPRRQGVFNRVLEIVHASPGVRGRDVAHKLREAGYGKPGERARDHGGYQILANLVLQRKIVKDGKGGYTVPRSLGKTTAADG